jgi:hypothetical protein
VGVGRQLQEADAACCFAAEGGWDGTRPEAWASECPLDLLSAAIEQCANTRDAAVVGWDL